MKLLAARRKRIQNGKHGKKNNVARKNGKHFKPLMIKLTYMKFKCTGPETYLQ